MAESLPTCEGDLNCIPSDWSSPGPAPGFVGFVHDHTLSSVDLYLFAPQKNKGRHLWKLEFKR